MDYAANIRTVLDRATVEDIMLGTDWYRTAHATAERFAREYGVSADTAARVIAVLSPRKRWAENVAAAETIMRAYASGSPVWAVAGMFGANVRKANLIMGGNPDALSGPKVTRFYQNIMGIDHEVTVDVWAARAASEGTIEAPTIVQYREIADAYRTVAHEQGIPASALQAIVWTVIRGKAH